MKMTWLAVCTLLAIVLAPFLLAGCGKSSTEAREYQSLADFGGRRIGVVTGAIQGQAIEKEIPTAQLCYYNSVPDLLSAARLDKVDAFSASNQIIRYLMLDNEDLTYLDTPLTEPMDIGAIFPRTDKGQKLRSEFNEYLAKARDEGTLNELDAIWLGKDESKKTVPDLSSLSGENGSLVLATDSSMVPNSYIKDNLNVGMDIDNCIRFCKEYGYALEIVDMSFNGIVDAVAAGKCDFAAGAIAYTKERAQSVDFSDPVFQTYSVVAYLKDAGAQTVNAAKTLDDLQNARIGIPTGTILADIVHAALPDTEILYFNAQADMVNALKSGKIDAFALDEPAARNVLVEDAALDEFPELLDAAEYAFALTKNERGEALCAELDEYIQTLWDDGTIESLQAKWFDSADLAALESTDYRNLPATKGTIRLVTDQYPPFIQVVDGFYSGYEIEILAMFCRDCGYALEIDDANFDGILASVQSGKADIGCCSITITEERKEVMLFSEPEYSGGTALVVMKDTPAVDDDSSFFSSVRESFEKTFIRENRWRLFLQGIGTTLLITALSILFGTLLGFFVFMLCRNGNPAANAITRFIVWLVRGMPVVVLLMVLYYIIFGSVSVSGTAVSVVGFTLVFGSGVYGIINSGVGAIGKGQLEAAYTLGYTNRRAFFKIILPQAMPHFMPAYKASITELIKGTAVVGYVAVQDLTKMGDIVRSRTYEAFFPLIAVAVIYFILAAVLTFIVNRIELRMDPKQRTMEKIRKEVEGE